MIWKVSTWNATSDQWCVTFAEHHHGHNTLRTLSITLPWYNAKKRIRFENTPRRVPTSFFFGRSKALRSQWNGPMNVLWPHDLDLWPMTLTYKLDLDILPLDLHAEIQVCMSVRSAMRVVTHTHTDRHTDTRCQNYYTHHVRDVGCNNAWNLMLVYTTNITL